jgi:uncharacterized OB-fold protein
MSDADGFRDGLAEERLLLRRCDACGRAAFPPMPGCPHCGHDEGTVVESSGAASLYSWTVCHVAFDPAFADDVPYVVGVVDVAEGARLIARVDAAPDALTADLALTATYPPGRDGRTRLTFVPTAGVTAAEPPRPHPEEA